MRYLSKQGLILSRLSVRLAAHGVELAELPLDPRESACSLDRKADHKEALSQSFTSCLQLNPWPLVYLMIVFIKGFSPHIIHILLLITFLY